MLTTVVASSRRSSVSRVSCAQSTATRILSPASSGRSRRRPCAARSRNEYSAGNGAAPASTMTVSLPSSTSARCIAISDPSASPSGFSCEVTRNRSPTRRASATASMSVVVWLIGRLCRYVGDLGAGVQIVDQLRHPDAVLDRLIVFEQELRRSAQMQLAVHARLQDPGGSLERGQGPESPLLAAVHAQPDGRLREV